MRTANTRIEQLPEITRSIQITLGQYFRPCLGRLLRSLLSFRFLQIEALILEQEIPKSKKIVNEHLVKPEVIEGSPGHRNSREENGV